MENSIVDKLQIATLESFLSSQKSLQHLLCFSVVACDSVSLTFSLLSACRSPGGTRAEEQSQREDEARYPQSATQDGDDERHIRRTGEQQTQLTNEC